MDRMPLGRDFQRAPAAASVVWKALTGGLLRCRRPAEAVHEEDILSYPRHRHVFCQRAARLNTAWLTFGSFGALVVLASALRPVGGAAGSTLASRSFHGVHTSTAAIYKTQSK